jgi:pimeloyl-ACP methyl ester carboxylesterase
MVALLDHLGVGKCLLMGSCIGPSFAFKLLEIDPERFPAAVMMQPIGRTSHTTEKEGWKGTNDAITMSWVEPFVNNMANMKVAEKEVVQKMTQNMITTVPSGPTDRFDFVFSVNRHFVQSLQNPLLVLMGQDGYHPSETSREIARLAPNADIIEEWTTPNVQDAITRRVVGFLAKNGAAIPAPSKL